MKKYQKYWYPAEACSLLYTLATPIVILSNRRMQERERKGRGGKTVDEVWDRSNINIVEIETRFRLQKNNKTIGGFCYLQDHEKFPPLSPV